MSRILCSVAVLVCLCACTHVSIEAADGAFERRTYVGVVSVGGGSYGTPGHEPVRQLDATTLGVRVDTGFSIGYLHDSTLSIPADCRLVVVVKTAAQLEHAARIFNSLTKEALCTVPSPG